MTIAGLFPWQGFQHPETSLPWTCPGGEPVGGQGRASQPGHTQPRRGSRARSPWAASSLVGQEERAGLRGQQGWGRQRTFGRVLERRGGRREGVFFQRAEARQNRELRDKSSSFSFLKKK